MKFDIKIDYEHWKVIVAINGGDPITMTKDEADALSFQLGSAVQDLDNTEIPKQ